MVNLRLWKVFFLLFEIFLETFASTHWVVTENGRIQPYLNSPFHLRRPYDLIALLDQETRRADMNVLYKDLVSRKNLIDSKWSGLEGAADLEARIHMQDPDCLKAGKLLSEIDLYSSIGSNGSTRTGITFDHIIKQHKIAAIWEQPECTKYSELDFSMFAFEHLHSVLNRNSVSLAPETGLAYLVPISNSDFFGHQVALGLVENSSSWIHYNLGIIFWRVRGNAPKAIECGRRALYYTPRQYKDIPLLNLAGVLHQARQPKDAAILLHAAVEHAPLQPANYLALGNVYAVIADYNRSIACYENVLKLQPDLENVISTKHATLCHKKLDSGLIELHESLQGILTDLHDYHTQQQQWLRLQERLLWEQVPSEAQLIGYNSEKSSANKGQRCVQRTSENSKSTITCDIDHQAIGSSKVDVTLNLQRLLKNVESETQKINEQMARNKRHPGPLSVYEDTSTFTKHLNSATPTSLNSINLVNGNSNMMPRVLHPMYPISLSTSNNKYFDATGWPSKDNCASWNLAISEHTLDLPVFLPPDNKGFQVSKMLTDYINLPADVEHELPWYPPICEHRETEAEKLYHVGSLHHLAGSTKLRNSGQLKKHFLKYINNGNAETSEIGQRILTAMHKRTGPGWVLATLASLYWRVRSNTKNALNCLDLAFENVPKEHTDVILVSIGSILHQLGLIDDAIKFATLAFKVNYVEPSTNFLLGLLHYAKKNPILAMYYMKNVLRVDPNYYNGKAEKLLKAWACRLKVGNLDDLKAKSDKPPEGMCSEKDAFNGEGVICSANGEQCKTAAIQCFRADSIHEESGTITIDIKPKMLSSQQCTKQKVGLGQSLISTLLAAEGSGGTEPDQSQLERLIENPQQAFQMRISLGDDHVSSGGNTLGDFYVSVSLTDDLIPEAMLHVYDRSGTYPLSPRNCRHIKDADWLQFTSMWQSIAARNVDIGPFLKPIPNTVKEDLQPSCSRSVPPPTTSLDYIIVAVLIKKLPSSPENMLSEWLGLMAGDQQASIKELGTKIELALQENTTSWILATAAALYWRVVGDAEQAVICLRQALNHVPNDMKDIPLISLSNVLHRVGLLKDAIEFAYAAVESHPYFVVNHFTAGNIHASLGDLEKAISFYRSSLVLDPSFEPARNRLQAILCTLLFDESGSLRDNADISEN